MKALPFQALSKSNYEWMIHGGIWTFVILERWVNHYSGDHATAHGVHQTFFVLVTIILPVYVNALFLIPRYLNRSHWIKYGILILTMLVVVNVIRGLSTIALFAFLKLEFDAREEFLKWALRDNTSLDRFVFGPTAWILWLSFSYRLIKDWILNENIKGQLLQEKLAMELAFLKAQMNPHFLFNTLNNIYALAIHEKADQTADGVAKMGALMRYNLHDCQAETILLEKEIEYIQHYIELQRLRITEQPKVTIATKFDIQEMKAHRIAPMVLLPFIENAFKYSVSTVTDSHISIHLQLNQGQLSFMVINSINPRHKSDVGGIGLKNVKDRLQLQYRDRFVLKTGMENEQYLVRLQINLAP